MLATGALSPAGRLRHRVPHRLLNGARHWTWTWSQSLTFRRRPWTLEAQGNVYVLSSTTLRLFSAGKMVKSLDLGTGTPWHSMAFDGKNIYITDFLDGAILKVEKNLASYKSFTVSGASRLLGIAVSPKNGDIFAAEVNGKAIFVLDSNGAKKRKINGLNMEKDVPGFVTDLQLDASGGLLETDQYLGAISKMGPDGKIRKFQKVPWTSPSYERAAILGSRIYMNCYKDQRLVVMGLDGGEIGHLKKDLPQALGAGMDGFLYLSPAARVIRRSLSPLKQG